jgi:hypothetical protein
MLALGLILAVPLVAGCSTPHKEIDAVGVVASQDMSFNDSGTAYTFKFDDGRTFTMHYAGHVGVAQPRIGDLIIAGSKPSNWMLVARQRDPVPDLVGTCYGLVENGEERDTVELDFGVTLQKAPDFEEGGRNPKNSTRITGGVICLNRDGQVRKIY